MTAAPQTIRVTLLNCALCEREAVVYALVGDEIGPYCRDCEPKARAFLAHKPGERKGDRGFFQGLIR
jgi:hypothetical protein